MGIRKPDDFVPEPTFVEPHKRAGKARCQAWSYRNGRQCTQYAMLGKRVCGAHGGKSFSGIASATFKTGRYSKYLPARLQERYAEAVQDTELLSLRRDLGLVETRLTDLLSRIETSESGFVWKQVRAYYNELTKGIAEQDRDKITSALRELDGLIRRGQNDYSIWLEINQTIDLRRRLVESEQKRLIAIENMMTIDNIMGYFSAITAAVRENVTDSYTLARIQEAFNRINNQANK